MRNLPRNSLVAIAIAAVAIGCAQKKDSVQVTTRNDSPGRAELSSAEMTSPQMSHLRGDASAGKNVFVSETFGNEKFWTDAVRLPQGIVQSRLTPLQALDLGLSVDIVKVPVGTLLKVGGKLLVDRSGKSSSSLNDPAVTIKLINANAVIGVVAVDSNGDGKIDIEHGDKVGVSCALCHTRTDVSVLNVPDGGSIGNRVDGLATHNLHVGEIFAAAANTRALYPMAQLALRANGGKTFGRATRGLTADSTEAAFDAYFKNHATYPVGMFDDSVDGNGDPMHNTPLFRQDLAAPFGTDGSIAQLDNFSNLVYTILFDPTILTTPGGRAYLHKLGGAAGDEIADEYVKVLAATGVKGYPFVKAAPVSAAAAGSEAAPAGVRVDQTKLLDLNAFLDDLPAPDGKHADSKERAAGMQLFASSGCTGCHNADQRRPVNTAIVPMKTIFPGDNPTILAQREPPLNPVMDTPGQTFDDKMAVVNASQRGAQRGISLPLLLDLQSKPNFLHDSSVDSLNALLDPARGPSSPHPFFIRTARERAEVTAFLLGLDTNQ